ncbi:MAG: type II secretion system protein GspC [Halioglobus sp.]
MAAQWQQSSSDSLDRLGSIANRWWQILSKPEHAHRVRQVFIALLLVWAVFALVQLVWTFIPRSESALPVGAEVLNPMESRVDTATADKVDIEVMLAWHLFGVAGASDPAVEPGSSELQDATVSSRDGIEDGARESRLDLTLRGVVAASEDGLGHAIIEHRKKQEVYAVGDKLPTGNGVTLAKVMPDGVVLDNAGTYELLKLFDDNNLAGQIAAQPSSPAAVKSRVDTQARQVSGNKDAALSARSFRQQLYDNPQALAEVVRVSAVREDSVLKGYRIDPGSAGPQQFTNMGFKAGDIVTSVNGVGLDNPGNAMQLYQMMRTATEAVFDLERGAEQITLTVNLEDTPPGGG